MPGLRGRSAAPHQQFVEHYTRALDRLSSAHEAQRVGAMRTLEALGQAHPAQRQAIVDVFCGYLRTPGDDEPVRQSAAQILSDLLRPTRTSYWPGINVDLAGARLTDLDLSDCRIDGWLRLDHAVLTGQSRLRGLTVGGTASLRGLLCWDHAWLERSTFEGPVSFDGATFRGDAWFGEAAFSGWASFAGVDFAGHAWFGACAFKAPVDFTHAVFRRSAGFRGAVADAGVGLGGTTFLGPARVSRRDDEWNVIAPGWRVVVDRDNRSVGQLLWVGHPELVEKPALHDTSEPTPV